MAYRHYLNPKFLVLLPLVIILVAAIACGADDATPVPPAPTATPAPTPTPVDLSAITSGLQEAVKATVGQALMEQAAGAEKPLSQAELQSLVARAVEASVPEGTSAEEIRKMVTEAVEATTEEGLSAAEIADLVSKSVAKTAAEAFAAQEAGLSPEDLRTLVERAVESAVPPETSPLEIRRMVEDAVKAAAQPGLTKDDVRELVTSAVSEAAGDTLTAADVQKIVEKAVATPTPLPAAAVTFEWETPAFMSQGKYGGVVPMSVLVWRTNWDPHQGTSLLEAAVNSGFWNQLMRFDYQDKDKLVGDLVKTWKLTPDGGYEFKLYEGAKFLDGETVNADDVKWSLDRMVEEGRPRPKAKLIGAYYESSAVIDERTVTTTLKIPGSPAFLQYLTVENMKILPKHVGDQFSDPEEFEIFLNDSANINGSGPFKFVDFKDGVSIEWTRNPDYWKDGLPFLDGVRMFLIPDNTRLIGAYKAEQILMPNFGDTGMGVRDLLVADKEWGDQIQLHWLGGTNLDVFVLNFAKPPFDDPRVRKAFYLGIDRVAHINTLIAGRGKMGIPFYPDTWMSPSDEVIGTWPGFRYVDKHTGEPILVPYGNNDAIKNPLDIVKAKALLAEAGFDEDNPLKITYNCFNLAFHSSVAQFSREIFKRFNVDAEIRCLDVPANHSEIRAGIYQIFHITRAADTLDSDDVFKQNYFSPGGGSNWDAILIPEINEIALQTQSESDPDKRQAQVFRATEILRQGELNHIGIAWIDRYALPVNSKVKNFRAARLLGENYMHEAIWLDTPDQFK